MLSRLATRRYRRLEVRTIDGEPAATGRHTAALTQAGFVTGYRGLTYRGKPSGADARI